MDAAAVDRETRTWAIVLHLSLLAGYVVPLGGFVAPIAIWLIKKDDLPALDAHGRAVANWIVSHLVYWAVSVVLCWVLIGIPMLIVLGVMSVAYPIIGAVKAADGKTWHYAGSMRLF